MIYPPSPPANIAPYVEVLGAQGAVEFILEFGGAELYLAPNPKRRSRLVTLVGHDKARRLAAAAEYLPARVPLAKPWCAAVLRSQNLSVAEIARKLHASDVSVRGWLKRYDTPGGDPRQMSLL
ncbi:hypothetical protein DDZ14_16200 [Maritimibacter sp. 55A14]|uniref:helix-turn-helix domain-containing protein n=1 Tax=Maritimibacter sp. 55A14 TaxID=2174844 RepID=UPI000D61FE3F|nr:helix-turn-helix domain-containing protein [Maritimibacter sp. 55A14]PWE29981.1 hypothetical protein DDZ14_16200 [Maritimibacter sp. 55A14]